jgi:hypothetical protein
MSYSNSAHVNGLPHKYQYTKCVKCAVKPTMYQTLQEGLEDGATLQSLGNE